MNDDDVTKKAGIYPYLLSANASMRPGLCSPGNVNRPGHNGPQCKPASMRPGLCSPGNSYSWGA